MIYQSPISLWGPKVWTNKLISLWGPKVWTNKLIDPFFELLNGFATKKLHKNESIKHVNLFHGLNYHLNNSLSKERELILELIPYMVLLVPKEISIEMNYVWSRLNQCCFFMSILYIRSPESESLKQSFERSS